MMLNRAVIPLENNDSGSRVFLTPALTTVLVYRCHLHVTTETQPGMTGPGSSLLPRHTQSRPATNTPPVLGNISPII